MGNRLGQRCHQAPQPASVELSLNYFIREGGEDRRGTELSPESLNLPAQPPQQDGTKVRGWGLQPHPGEVTGGQTGPGHTNGLSSGLSPRRAVARAHGARPADHPGRGYLGVLLPFLGVVGFLLCQRCPWMVKASTLMDMVLAGIWVKRFRSELYL